MTHEQIVTASYAAVAALIPAALYEEAAAPRALREAHASGALHALADVLGPWTDERNEEIAFAAYEEALDKALAEHGATARAKDAPVFFRIQMTNGAHLRFLYADGTEMPRQPRHKVGHSTAIANLEAALADGLAAGAVPLDWPSIDMEMFDRAWRLSKSLSFVYELNEEGIVS